MAELALDDTERMLDPRPLDGFLAVVRLLFVVQRMTARAALVRAVLRVGCAGIQRRLLPDVGRVAVQLLLVALQQVGQFLAVVPARRRHRGAVDAIVLDVRADVQLVAETPAASLLGGTRIRIAILRLVLGGARRLDHGGVHHRAAADGNAGRVQRRVHRGGQHVGKFLLSQPLPKLDQGRAVGHRLQRGVEAAERPGARGVQQQVDRPLVRQSEPLLHEVDAQLALDPHRLPTQVAAGGVVAEFVEELGPGHHLLHAVEKPLLARHPSVHAGVEIGGPKRILDHDRKNDIRKLAVSSSRQFFCAEVLRY